MEEEKQQKIIKWFIVGIVIIAVLLLASFILTSKNNKKNKISDYVSEQATYKATNTGLTSTLPALTLDSEDAKKINAKIKEEYTATIQKKNTQFTYQASLNKKYISLAIMVNKVENKGYPYTTIKTYNFDKKTGALVDDETLLNEFQTSIDKIAASFENEMKTMYEEEVEGTYLNESECNYDCFLQARNVTNYQDDIHLYVRNNQLVYYRPFIIFSSFNDDDYYRYQNFLFNIK